MNLNLKKGGRLGWRIERAVDWNWKKTALLCLNILLVVAGIFSVSGWYFTFGTRRTDVSIDDHWTLLDRSQPGEVCDRSKLETILVYSSQSVGDVMSATVGTLGTLSVMEGGGDICL